MSSFALGHLADHVPLQGLKTLIRQDHATTAALLAHLAEIDARRLYARTCTSMFEYCVRKLGFSEDVAAQRIHATRTARSFPAVFAAVADGRLHVTGVLLLAPVLNKDNAAELLAAAAGKSRREIETLLAHRFPKPDVPEKLRPVDPEPSQTMALPEARPTGSDLGTLASSPASSNVMEPLRSYAPGHVAPTKVVNFAPTMGPLLDVAMSGPSPAPRERLAPISPGHYSFETTFDKAIVELLDRAKALLAHKLPSRNRTEVLRRVLRDWVQAAERRKFGLTEKPRAARKRAEARRRGEQKREAARAKEAERVRREAHAHELEANAEARTRALEVMPWLRALGVRADGARRAAATCAALPDAPLEVRVRHALNQLAPASARRVAPGASTTA